MERVMGVEPTSSAWKAEVLPLNYTRLSNFFLLLQHSLYRRALKLSYRLLCIASKTAIRAFIRRAKILTVFVFELSGFRYSNRCLVEGVGFEPT